MYIICVPGVCKGQNRVLDVKLQLDANHYMGARNLNLGSLQEQQVLSIAAKPSLLPPRNIP